MSVGISSNTIQRLYDQRILGHHSNSFLMVPFFALLGKTAFAAKIPTVLISCLFFPWLVYALTRVDDLCIC